MNNCKRLFLASRSTGVIIFDFVTDHNMSLDDIIAHFGTVDGLEIDGVLYDYEDLLLLSRDELL